MQFFHLPAALLLFHRFCYGSYHDPLLFGRIVKTGVQVASPLLLGLLLLDLERIGCRPRVLARARYLPTDLHPLLAARYLEAVLRNLLGNVQVWRSPTNGGELVAKISIYSFEPLGQLYPGGAILIKLRNAVVDVLPLRGLDAGVHKVLVFGL